MRRIFVFTLFVFTLNLASALTFNDIPDDYVIANVGVSEIIKSDLVRYMAGYSTVKEWDSEKLQDVLDAMITDLLFMNACLDEKITVKAAESYWYAEYYFKRIGIDINNEEAVQRYFNITDPYYDMEDFLNKSIFFLLKSKYLMNREIIDTVRASHIFFSTEKKKRNEITAIEKKAIQLAYSIIELDMPFYDLFSEFSDLKEHEMGSISYKSNNQYVPKSETARVIKSGLFSPVFVKSNKGFSIVFNTTYALPPYESITKVIEELRNKYTVKINLRF
jgi:hypothetical protein